MIDGIYLDNNATTPCDPRVTEEMLPYFGQWYGNPANGLHTQGRKAARAVDEAREQIAALLSAHPGEIIFTSGATESNNLAILGLARVGQSGTRNHIVTSAVEHKAVLLPCKKSHEEGFELTVLPVDHNGRVSPEAAREAITEKTLLVSIQAANNEIGTLQPVQEIAAIAHEKGALLHCDAAQAIGKIVVDVTRLEVDLLSASAHKLYGPKGIGCLYIRGSARAIPLAPLTYGGGQEDGIRSGTANVPAIVGFGKACELAAAELLMEAVHIESLRDGFESALQAAIPQLRINGHAAKRLPNTSSITFPGVDADALLLNLPNVMMGTGSACMSGAIEPSHVLTALGVTRQDAFSTVRASLGRFTIEAALTSAVKEIIHTVHALARGSST